MPQKPRPRSSAPKVARSTPLAPVSWGELLDKITILEIKAERIGSASARANVRRELGALNAVAASAPRRRGLAAMKRKLREINLMLWEVEDEIRTKERDQVFDARFIALARAVYRTNDRRGAVKRAINELLGSELVEEKHYARY